MEDDQQVAEQEKREIDRFTRMSQEVSVFIFTSFFLIFSEFRDTVEIYIREA